MLEVLIGGKLKGGAESKTSASGIRYTRCRVLVHVEGDESVLVSVVAFGDQASALAALGDGEAVSVAGSAKLTHWTGNDGDTKVGLKVIASALLSVYAVKKKREAACA